MERTSHRSDGDRTYSAMKLGAAAKDEEGKRYPKVENVAARKDSCVLIQVYLTLSSET